MPQPLHKIHAIRNGTTFTYWEEISGTPAKHHTMRDNERVGWKCEHPPGTFVAGQIRFNTAGKPGCPFQPHVCPTIYTDATANWTFYKPHPHTASQDYRYVVAIDGLLDDPDIQVDDVVVKHWGLIALGILVGVTIVVLASDLFRSKKE